MAESSPIPAYCSFTTFWNLVEELHDRGPAPQVMEKGVFGPNRSGAAIYELLHALRFLGLIDEEKRPTQSGRELIASPTPENLRSVLDASYPEAMNLGLETATPGQLNEVLKRMGLKESSATLRKARTFFLQAAERSGMSVGPHLKTRGPVRTTTTRRKRAPQAPQNGAASFKQSSDLRTRYIEMLMEKAQAQETPDDGLLDRIEAALKEVEHKT